MSLFNVKPAIEAHQERQAQKQAAQPPKGTSMRPSSDRLAHLEAKFRALESRVDGLESWQGEQQQWNAIAQSKVQELEQKTSDTPCPGCGQPMNKGMHGVTCFRTVDA